MITTTPTRADLALTNAPLAPLPARTSRLGTPEESTQRRDKPRGIRWHDSMNPSGVHAGFAAALEPLHTPIDALASNGQLQVLDCGIGAGHLSAAIAAHVHARAHVTGVDVSPGMLAAADQRLSPMGCTFDGYLADSRRLPLESNRFDLVISAHMLEHLPSPVAALAHMHRVLRPGGMVILALTRRSLASLPARLLWRVRTASPLSACNMLTGSGFCHAQVLPPAGPALFQRLTLLAVGRKFDGTRDNRRA